VHLSDREAYTIGGLVTARLRRIPQVADNVEESGLMFIVEKASDRGPLLIRIRLV
jgi:CBS domain containing-hemolysin-like protein